MSSPQLSTLLGAGWLAVFVAVAFFNYQLSKIQIDIALILLALMYFRSSVEEKS